MNVFSFLLMGIGSITVLFLIVIAAEQRLLRRSISASGLVPLQRQMLWAGILALLIGVGINVAFFAARQDINRYRVFISFAYSFGLSFGIIGLVYPVRRSLLRYGPGAARYLLLFLAVICGALLATIACNLLFAAVLGRTLFGAAFSRELAFNLGLAVVIAAGHLLYELMRAGIFFRVQKHALEVQQLRELKTRAELDALQAKVNPHFVYNALNSVAGLVHESPDRAEQMVLLLSRFFRFSLAGSERNYSSVQEELEIVECYLAIEKVRFGAQISFAFDVDPAARTCLLPRFLLQPLVENALKHGLAAQSTPGRVEICAQLQGQALRICIHDTGKPFGKDITSGYGLQSTADKLALLFPNRHEIHIEDSPRKQICIIINPAVNDETGL